MRVMINFIYQEGKLRLLIISLACNTTTGLDGSPFNRRQTTAGVADGIHTVEKR